MHGRTARLARIAWRLREVLFAGALLAAPAAIPTEGAEPAPASPANNKAETSVDSGRVTDPQGHPLEGVTVRVCSGMGTLWPVNSTTTDQEGRYTLRYPTPAPYQSTVINAHKAGYALNREMGNDFILEPASTVELELVGTDDQPIAQRSVCLTSTCRPSACNALACEKTDAQGKYRFEGVPTSHACWFSLPIVRGREVRTASMNFTSPEEYRVRLRLGRDSYSGLDLLEVVSVCNAQGEEVRPRVVADEPLAYVPLDDGLQWKGQRILTQIAEANRYWLEQPPSEVRSYRYEAQVFRGETPTWEAFEVPGERLKPGVARPGLEAASVLADLIAHPSNVIFRRIEVGPEAITLMFTFINLVPVYHGGGIQEATLTVAPETLTPRTCQLGNRRETFADYVELRPKHFVPQRIEIAKGGFQQELHFAIYEPGLWLLDLDRVRNVSVNGEPAKAVVAAAKATGQD